MITVKNTNLMKTRTLIESIKSRAFYLVLCLAMAAGFVGCSTEEVTEDDDITGLYIGGSEDTGETKITISKNSSGYTFNCTYEDWGAANSRLNVPIVEWKGTFTKIPSDVIKNSKGEKIGEIEFTKTNEYIQVEFTSFIEPKDTYRAKKGGEMADVNL